MIQVWDEFLDRSQDADSLDASPARGRDLVRGCRRAARDREVADDPRGRHRRRARAAGGLADAAPERPGLGRDAAGANGEGAADRRHRRSRSGTARSPASSRTTCSSSTARITALRDPATPRPSPTPSPRSSRTCSGGAPLATKSRRRTSTAASTAPTAATPAPTSRMSCRPRDERRSRGGARMRRERARLHLRREDRAERSDAGRDPELAEGVVDPGRHPGALLRAPSRRRSTRAAR